MVSVYLLGNVHHSFRHELDDIPETLGHYMGTSRFSLHVLDPLLKPIKTLVYRCKMPIQIIFEILIHGSVPSFRDSTTEKGNKEEGNDQACPGRPSLSQRYPRHL